LLLFSINMIEFKIVTLNLESYLWRQRNFFYVILYV